jgi:hypothetical protein
MRMDSTWAAVLHSGVLSSILPRPVFWARQVCTLRSAPTVVFRRSGRAVRFGSEPNTSLLLLDVWSLSTFMRSYPTTSAPECPCNKIADLQGAGYNVRTERADLRRESASMKNQRTHRLRLAFRHRTSSSAIFRCDRTIRLRKKIVTRYLTCSTGGKVMAAGNSVRAQKR